MMRRQGWRAYDRIRRLASYVVALVGLLGLLSAISRPARGRLQDLLQVLPFVVPRSAAITLVFVSFALLLTARGLRHGQRLAWASTLLLLATSAVLHVLKGLAPRMPSLTWITVFAVLGLLGLPLMASFPAEAMTFFGSVKNQPLAAFAVAAGLAIWTLGAGRRNRATRVVERKLDAFSAPL